MDLKPFVNFALSQLDTPVDYKRINYTAGFYINNFFHQMSLKIKPKYNTNAGILPKDSGKSRSENVIY